MADLRENDVFRSELDGSLNFFFFFLQNANPTPFLAVVIVIVISEDVLVEARIYLQPFCYSVESKQQNEYLI